MSPAELLALSLVASMGVAIVALGAGIALERISSDQDSPETAAC